eukprot:XP_004918536.2 PREDICTED: polycystin-1-like [Xenopus tropicalis]
MAGLSASTVLRSWLVITLIAASASGTPLSADTAPAQVFNSARSQVPPRGTVPKLRRRSTNSQPFDGSDLLPDSVDEKYPPGEQEGGTDTVMPSWSLRCPPRCRCTPTLVNCSGAGLWKMPPAGDCPPETAIMDLSRNQLTLLQIRELIGYRSLRKLILRENQIQIIDESAVVFLPPLQSLDLLGNGLPCTCPLQRFISRLSKGGDLETDRETELCAQGPGASVLPCAEHYISCVPGSPDSVLPYSFVTPATLSASSCLALCFRHGHSHYGQDDAQRCLCGSISTEPVDPCDVCPAGGQNPQCNKALIPDPHPVEVSVSLSGPLHCSVFQLAEFSAFASIPITRFVWHFVPGEEPVVTTDSNAHHKYSLPGQYRVLVLAEGQRPGAEALVRVIVPVQGAELQCPPVAQTGQNVEVWLNVHQGTDLQAVYGVQEPEGHLQTDDSSCPRGGRVFQKNLNCYWLNQVKESFADSRSRCRSIPGGDIAYIETIEELTFLQEIFLNHAPVWVNVSQSKDLSALMSPALYQECSQLPLVPGGTGKSRSCNEKAPSLCTRKAGVPLPDVPTYLVGIPVLTDAETHNASLADSVTDLQGDIEIMLFPGLWFSHSGSPVSLEFGVQPLKNAVEARIQILRPFCSPEQHLVPPGCDLLRNPFAICHNQPLCNTKAGCATGQQWCPLIESCLSITQPCSTYTRQSYLHPPRYLGTPPAYSPVADIPLLLEPSTCSRNMQVLLSSLSISVQPDDILSIQHSGDQGSFLRCIPHGHSAWSQSYLSMSHWGWWEESLQVETPSWMDDMVCDLRATFASEVQSLVVSPLLASFQEPGTYTVSATLHNAVSETEVACEVCVLRPVTGLQIISPTPYSDPLHVPTHDRTLLAIRALSSTPASVLWESPVQREEAELVPTCPQSMAASLPACLNPSGDTRFGWMWLRLEEPLTTMLTIVVTNDVSAQNLSVQIQSHDAIRGLHIQPDGPQHIQVNQTQIFTANVSQGSSVKFTWIVDKMEGFVYQGQSYKVTFRTAGSYRMRVQAENPVSSQVVDVLLTVHGTLPLQKAKLVAPSSVLLVSESQEIGFEIQVDGSSDVTISWDFGDGSPKLTRRFSPPYNPQLPRDPKRQIVTLSTKEDHHYMQEGHYEVTVMAYNNVSQITRSLQLVVVHALTSLILQVTPQSPQPRSVALFSGACLPSSLEVKLSWDFGDGSKVAHSDSLQSENVYPASGFYNVTVTASNGRSHVSGSMIVMVGQMIEGLEVMSSGLSELGTQTVVTGSLRKGTDITWSFDMGDGKSYTDQSEPSVRHTYKAKGIFTVLVVAKNAMNSVNLSINIQVYQVTITDVTFPPVVSSLNLTKFIVHVNVPSVSLGFLWDFGDGNPPEPVSGKAEVWHSYLQAGNYRLQITVNGTVTTTTQFRDVTVEDQIRSVSLIASPTAANLSQPILFSAAALPSPDPQHLYMYQWNLGLGSAPMDSSSSEISWTYSSEGSYNVLVTVWNSVSKEQAQCHVIVQRPISSLAIQHNGGEEAVLVGAKQFFTAKVNDGVTAEFTWDFSDLSHSSYGPTVAHTFTTAGYKTVTVYAKNKVSEGKAFIVLSVQAPVAALALSVDHRVAEPGQPIHFWASTSSGDLIQFQWSLCEHCPYIEGTSQFHHIFSKPGIYVVSVVARNALSSARANITLEVQEAVEGVSVQQENAEVEGYAALAEPLTLAAHMVKGSNLTFQWVTWPEQWGGQDRSLTFTPVKVGEIGAEVWVKNALGVTSANIQLQVIERVSGVQVQKNQDPVALGSNVELTVTIQHGTNLQYKWDPGEGSVELISQSPSLNYTYLIPGPKTIKVVVSNALSSSSALAVLRVQQPISGVSISLTESRDYDAQEYELDAVKSGTAMFLVGSVQNGSDLSWEWAVTGHKQVIWYHVQNVSHTFIEPGQYQVQLRVWNIVSSANASHLLLVQEAVTSLRVTTEQNGYCTGQNVTFFLSIEQGTHVSFMLTVPFLNLHLKLDENCGHLVFPFPGNYTILATALNQVSKAEARLDITVLEKVESIQVLDLPSAWSVNKTLRLKANIKPDPFLNIFWTFWQNGDSNYSLSSYNAAYTPLRKGSLHIHLNVSNPFCSSSLSSVVIIQEPVTSMILRSNTEQVFLNHCVQFFVEPKDGSDLRFHWSFGDAQKNITSSETSVEHCYSHPGNFLATAVGYNLVSLVQAQTKVHVTMVKCKQPKAQLLGAPAKMPRSLGGQIEVSVDLRGCTEYKVIYLWEFYKGSNCSSNQLSIPKLDISSPLLTIYGHTLDIGLYCLLMTVKLQGTSLSHQVTHLLTVTPSPLVAVIHGGTKRIWPVERDLVLDGTASHDPDLADGVKETSLEYEWSSDPMIEEPACMLPSLPSISQVSVSLPALCADSTYIFTLTVKKPGREPATAKQMVSLHGSSVLVVSPRCISCNTVSSSMMSSKVPVILSGECDTCDRETQYTWSAVDSNGLSLMLDNQTTTTGPRRHELVVRKGILEDGLNYTFTLKVIQLEEQRWGEGSITLMANNPPSGGQCTLFPQNTILWLETPLQYNCTGWMDPDKDGQLLFSLSVQMCSRPSCRRLHLYRGPRSWNRVQAPAGSQEGDIQVFVEIEDMKGARTLAINRTLTVSIPHTIHGTTQLLSTQMGEIVQQLQREGDLHHVLPLALEVVTALNLDSGVTEEEQSNRTDIRDNITSALTSLRVSNLWEVAAVSAALTQCVASPHEISPGTWLQTLEAAENMINVMATESGAGRRAETETSENVLTLLGSAMAASPSEALSLFAFNLTQELTKSAMRSRVISEEPLSLKVPGVRVHGSLVLPEDLPHSQPSALCLVGNIQGVPTALKGHSEVLQLVTEMDKNPFSSGLLPNAPVTTKLVSLEFSSPEGDTIAVTDLPLESAIQLRLPAKSDVSLIPTAVPLAPGDSANLTVSSSLEHTSSGLHLHISTSLPTGFVWHHEDSPGLLFAWGPILPTNQCEAYGTHVFRLFKDAGSTQEFSLLFPLCSLSFLEFYVNITSLLSVSPVNVSVSLFSSLCQYFHVPSQTWRTEGMTPSNASQPSQAVCHTRHLTLFGASLFVPPHHLVLLPPAPRPGQWTLVLLVCSLLLSMYLVLLLISHKLDHLDVSRVGTIPLCGQRSQYKYWVLVKTGWKRGAGTTAHVGISLYGLSKSGARYLESGGAFGRGSIDYFQVETECNMGEIWKIRVWHDNTGLDPSWYLQYVAVWDKQTDFLYFFLVNDWLSVENERNGGRVEKEILAACPQELRGFYRVFLAQLLLGFTDWHLWLSVWWRPARSRFTRVQRVTCCALTLHLYVASCALWYGAVGFTGESSPLGVQSLVTWESVFVGVVVSLLVLPLQLLFTFLFRETRSMVTVEDAPLASPAMEQDSKCGDTSSILSIPGGHESLVDISSLSRESVSSSKLNFDIGDHIFWQEEGCAPLWFSSCDTICDSPYETPWLQDTDAGLSFPPSLRRKKGKICLGFESSCSSGDDPLSLSGGSSSCRRLFLSENLLQSITTGTRLSEGSDSGRFSPRTDLRSISPESFSSGWSDNGRYSEDWMGAKRWSFASSFDSEANSQDSELQQCCDGASLSPSPFTTRIGVRWIPPRWLFPPCIRWVLYPVLVMLLASCIILTILYSSSLSDQGILMWLISSTCALLASAIFLEPLKVLVWSLLSALWVPPVLSEGDGLVEEPLVKKISDRPCTVRAPGGFSLLQAKEEARRVRALRSLLRSCAGHMVFFLLVLMVNYQNSFHDANIRLLHTAMKQSVNRATSSSHLNASTIQSVSGLWHWLDTGLLAHLYSDPRVSLMGAPRLCQQPALLDPLPDWLLLAAFQSSSLDRNSSVGSLPIYWGDTEPCINHGCPPIGCQDLGTDKKEIQHNVRRLKAANWMKESSLSVEITQYHRDVQLHISTRLCISLSARGHAVSSLSILPFHLQETREGLSLPFVLAVSLLFAALCFLLLELRALARCCTDSAGYSPNWTRLVLGLLSGGVGIVYVLRMSLTKQLLQQYRAQPTAFTSFYTVAVLARTEVALAATLLLLGMLKLAQQLRFVRRWAIFGKAFQNVKWELLGSSLITATIILALTHSLYVVSCAVYPSHHIPGNKLLRSVLGKGSIFRPVLQNSPALGFCAGLGICLLAVCRGILCAAVLSGHRKVRAESYRPVLEPQDYEMIDFLVKRFKLWLGLIKAKEYRHTVRFEGLKSACSRSSNNARLSCPQSATRLSTRSASVSPDVASASPRPVLTPGLAVERLPTAVTDLLDKLDKVTTALEEVCALEQRLEEWHRTVGSTKPSKTEKPSTSTNKHLQLPRTYSTFSESAITQMQSKVLTYNGSRLFLRPAPDSADHMRRARLHGAPSVSHGVRGNTWRPNSEESSRGRKPLEDPNRPIPRKRRAWDCERQGDT